MDASTIALLFTFGSAVVLEVVKRILVSGDDKRARRKDLREEIKELWDRIDEQDEKIAAKDAKITEQDAKIADLYQWKQRYTALQLERDSLVRTVEEMQRHIRQLEQQVKELQENQGA